MAARTNKNANDLASNTGSLSITSLEQKNVSNNNQYTIGFRLLDKFQYQWEQIHSKSEQNVIKANMALDKMNSIDQNTVKHMVALDSFFFNYKSMQKLNEQIDTIESDLKLLENNFGQIEDLLIVLKNFKENLEVKKYVDEMESNYQLQASGQKTLSNVRKERLKLDHLERVEAIEKEEERELQERRKILEQAFQEEKSRYLEKSKTNQTG